MEEIWKEIKGYEGVYQVSNLGNVKNKYGRILKPIKVWYGYLEVHLKKNNKRYHHKIHRLVAEAFIPNPNNYPIINHKDEDKTNNCSNNLEWCTYLYNNNYGTRNKMLNSQKRGCIKRPVRCLETNKIYLSITEASKSMNINGQLIGRCCRKEKNSAGGYHWEYV